MRPTFYILFTFCCLLTINAQNTAKKDSLLNRELMLEREYNPSIRDAVKLSQLPDLREPQAPKSSVEFSNYAVPYNVQSKIFPLSPQSYLKNVNSSKYKGFLKGGISNLIDIDADFGYQLLNTDKDRLNIFLTHRSSASNISFLQEINDQDGEKRKFKINDNWGGLNFLHNFGDTKFFADIKYTFSAFNYYGLSMVQNIPTFSESRPLNNFDNNSIQINNMFETHFGFSSDKPSALNYNFKAGYTNFQQKYGNTENTNGGNESRILIEGDISHPVSSVTRMGLSATTKVYSYSDPINKYTDSTSNYWTGSLTPYLFFEDDNFKLLLGAKVDAEIGSRKKIVGAPAIKFDFFPSERFMFYIHAGGGRKDNSQYDMFYENRYVDPVFRVLDSRSPLDATAGVKFSPLSTFTVGIFGGYKITRDEHFFYTVPAPKLPSGVSSTTIAKNWIAPIYEDANTLKLGADFNYSFQDIFDLNANWTYYNWSITSEKHSLIFYIALNKPDFEMNLNAGYNLSLLPLRFDLSYYSAIGRKVADFSIPAFIKMNDIHDLSLKGTYSFTPYFSAYLSLNNLLFQKYDFWWGYPAQGFNAMGGLSVLF